MSTTLVIHPKDKTTDCLEAVYKNLDCDVIRHCNIPKEQMRKEITKHNRIIMLGHGTPAGLLDTEHWGMAIDGSYADLLKEKDTYSIWCNSDKYFEKYNIPGFHTGMIISEVGEEHWVLGYAPLDEEGMAKNMELFCRVCGEAINYSPEEAAKYVLDHYVGDDPVTQYNRTNIKVLS